MSILAPKPTTFLKPERLADALGIDLTLAVETFQYTGSFKYRAAANVAANVPNPHVITASSGNFGQAIALACKLAGKRCTVVMPTTSSKVKVEAVKGYGATIDLVDTTTKQREERVAELASAHADAYIASAYDDPLVIEGNASLGREIAQHAQFDVVISPIGGGGLASGIAQAFHASSYSCDLLGAEPALGNDAARSLRAGSLLANEREPATLADGARTRSLGKHNWEILRSALSGIVEVSEPSIEQAVQHLFLRANLKAEPTGALTTGALLQEPGRYAGKRVLCVVSGGNVEPALYASLLTKAP